MKPDWDELGSRYEESSSVVIADVDCTVEADLCKQYSVQGYPTIKYFSGETGKEGKDYQGGRTLDALQGFVTDNLEVKCSVAEQGECSEREVSFIAKMKAKAQDEIAKQLARLKGMTGKSMAPKLKAWVVTRIRLLADLIEGEEPVKEDL